MSYPSTFDHLEGHRFPGGTYRLPAYETWLWADAVGATPDPDAAHPGMAYVVGLLGAGASIQDIFGLLGADANSGVLFGRIEMAFLSPLVPDREYRVDGEVLTVERKHGKRTGPFDRVTFRHHIYATGHDDGQPVAVVTHTWIFPRGATA